jgi:hypothetical protein
VCDGSVGEGGVFGVQIGCGKGRGGGSGWGVVGIWVDPNVVGCIMLLCG